jgi:hypothetical protein
MTFGRWDGERRWRADVPAPLMRVAAAAERRAIFVKGISSVIPKKAGMTL